MTTSIFKAIRALVRVRAQRRLLRKRLFLLDAERMKECENLKHKNSQETRAIIHKRLDFIDTQRGRIQRELLRAAQ